MPTNLSALRLGKLLLLSSSFFQPGSASSRVTPTENLKFCPLAESHVVLSSALPRNQTCMSVASKGTRNAGRKSPPALPDCPAWRSSGNSKGGPPLKDTQATTSEGFLPPASALRRSWSYASWTLSPARSVPSTCVLKSSVKDTVAPSFEATCASLLGSHWLLTRPSAPVVRNDRRTRPVASGGRVNVPGWMFSRPFASRLPSVSGIAVSVPPGTSRHTSSTFSYCDEKRAGSAVTVSGLPASAWKDGPRPGPVGRLTCPWPSTKAVAFRPPCSKRAS